MSFTVEEREVAIRESTDDDVACCHCIHTSDDGYKLSCHQWCCGVEDSEVCDKFEDQAK